MNKLDFIGAAIHNLTGNIPGAFFFSGKSEYKNLVWNTSLYTGKIPTEAEVDAQCEALLLAEPKKRLRIHRDRLLTECDWTQLSDAKLSSSKKNEWIAYRQSLRDLPATASPELDSGFIKNVTWPVKPTQG